MKLRISAAIALVSLASSALADPLMLYPVQTGAETLRFRTGIPTLNLETASGAIQITPLPFDHGHVTFGLGIYNKGAQAANFGIENIQASLQGQAVPVLSSQELQKRAKSRAAWSQIGMALLVGAAAAAVSQAHTTNTYHSQVRTPNGTYSWSSSYRDNTIGTLGAAAAVAGGVVAINGIQNRLDYTLANLSEEIIQTTTVDPEASYGGRIVIEKSDKAKPPYDVRVVIAWNGAEYPFVFRVTKEGVNVPAPYTTAPTVQPAPLPASAQPNQPTASPAQSTPAVQ